MIRNLCEDSGEAKEIVEEFVTDPFENEDASYLVLVNQLNQHSLWPQAIEVPAGWRVVFGGGRRQECLDYVEANWTDIAPKPVPSGEHARD